MEKIEIFIGSGLVFQEVFKKTEYVGSKRTGEDAKLYEQARATKYNEEILSDYFKEACSMADLNLKEYLTATLGATDPNNYKRWIQPGSRYNNLLTDTLISALNNFFVSYIVGKWLKLCNFEESSEYLTLAAAAIQDVRSKLLNKKRPDAPVDHSNSKATIKGGFLEDTVSNKTKKHVKGKTK